VRFVVAAYVVSLVTLLAYGANLARERRALRRELRGNPE
jgi:hypothetical protein